ncbi:MAG: DNA topoisomerase I [archaeon]
MKLIIAEKAIAGKRIAEILSNNSSTLQMLNNAMVLSFQQEKEGIEVIPLSGHIVEVDFPKKYSYWIGTDLRKLVNAEIEYVGTQKNIISLIKTHSPKINEVIIATDADREGESIGLEALNYIKEINPKVTVKRAIFSAITESDLNEAFKNLTTLNYDLADSANARREIDLIWGAVLTRFLSIVSGRLGKEFISAGRVQTPVLALIVKREKERLAFKPEKFFEINAVCEKDKKKFEAQHQKGKFKSKEEAESIHKKLIDAKNGTITEVKKRKKTIAKPLPFNTTEFLRAATATGFTAGKAMNLAESLYMKGLTSYPRTDNQVYAKSLDLKKVLKELSKIGKLKEEAGKLLAKKTLTPSKGKESKDHPPIYPVAAPKENLSDQEWRIYELIARRFMATLADDAITENTSVTIDIEKELFTANGQVILEKGWKEFYPYSTLKETILPKLEKGDKVSVLKIDFLSKETQPPARYSQGALIKLMSDLNLGTKATRHEIIQKLFARSFLTGAKYVEPTTLAIALIGALEKYAEEITKPGMTARLEKEMDEIALNSKEKTEVVTASREMLAGELEKLLKEKDKIGSELRNALREDSKVGKCDACDGMLVIRKSRYGKRFLGCNNYPKCTTTYPLPQKGRLYTLDKTCPECGKPTVKLVGQRYRFEMCVDMDCKTKDGWKKKKAEKDAKEEKEKEENEKEEKKEIKENKKEEKERKKKNDKEKN